MRKRIEVMKRAGFGVWFIEKFNFKTFVWEIFADFPTLDKARDFVTLSSKTDRKNNFRIYNYIVDVVVE